MTVDHYSYNNSYTKPPSPSPFGGRLSAVWRGIDREIPIVYLCTLYTTSRMHNSVYLRCNSIHLQWQFAFACALLRHQTALSCGATNARLTALDEHVT